MKKIVLTMMMCAGIALANAGNYLDEVFNYNEGNLVGQEGWASSGSVTTGTGKNIMGGNLSYSNTGGTYILSESGKTLNSDITEASNYFVHKKFNESDISEGVIYVSFLFKAGVDQTQSNADVLALTNWNGSNNTTNSTGPRVWVGKAAAPNDKTHFRFGTTRYSTTGSDIVWGAEFSNETYTDAIFLIVLKYDATNKTTTLYVNPIIGSASEPASYATANEGTSTRNVSYVLMRANGKNATKFNIGGLRIATTWNDVIQAKTSTSIDKVDANKGAVVSTQYFTVTGIQVKEPQRGNIYIQKATYEDGSVETSKYLKK